MQSGSALTTLGFHTFADYQQKEEEATIQPFFLAIPYIIKDSAISKPPSLVSATKHFRQNIYWRKN